ncbi:MAG: Fe-S cluster assembly protein SufD [Pelagibacterales bacterium]|nr:Fe-S cluster assembly protein SufD [Pelagibacterales bacterium]
MMDQIKIDFNKVIEPLKLSKENLDLRKKNLNEFINVGFPNKKLEEWKFSDLNQIISSNIKNLKFFDKELVYKKSIDPILIDQLLPKHFEHNKIIVVNGIVDTINFENEDIKKIKIIDKIENQSLNVKNSLVSLNNAFISNYLKIIIKENYALNKPLIIYNITDKKISSTNINQRLDIVLENNSKLNLINLLTDYSDNNFININHQFKVGKDAILKNYKIDGKQNSNIKYFYNEIDLDQNSLVENFILSSGSKFIKNEISCNLKGKYSSAFINGIINLNKSQQHEIKTNINHLAENTKSYQLIKSVLNENSKGIFQGKIFVDSKAQKTNGYQLSKALLLNENTEFDGKPELEIYADDVKCSHGSTSGSLDKNSIFYLMSRGLNHQESKKLLINGFLLDVIEKITDLEVKKLVKNIMQIKE